MPPTEPTAGTSLADVQAAMAANQAFQLEVMKLQTDDQKKMAAIHALQESAKGIR